MRNEFFCHEFKLKLNVMKSSDEQKSSENKSLNHEKDEKKFPSSQFHKDQRKDAERGLRESSTVRSKDEEKTENS